MINAKFQSHPNMPTEKESSTHKESSAYNRSSCPRRSRTLAPGLAGACAHGHGPRTVLVNLISLIRNENRITCALLSSAAPVRSKTLIHNRLMNDLRILRHRRFEQGNYDGSGKQTPVRLLAANPRLRRSNPGFVTGAFPVSKLTGSRKWRGAFPTTAI